MALESTASARATAAPTGREGAKQAVFFDKDGTLLENVPYNVNPDRMRLAPGALQALRLLQEAGYLLFVVSNQSGVARGIFEEEDLVPVRGRLEDLLEPAGVTLAGFYYCPHHPQGSVERYAHPCDCRKPQPGMLIRAAREHDLDLSSSWLVGDILDDVEAGRRAGTKAVLIDNGNETEWQITECRRPHLTAPGLEEAARLIARAATPAGGMKIAGRPCPHPPGGGEE